MIHTFEDFCLYTYVSVDDIWHCFRISQSVVGITAGVEIWRKPSNCCGAWCSKSWT